MSDLDACAIDMGRRLLRAADKLRDKAAAAHEDGARWDAAAWTKMAMGVESELRETVGMSVKRFRQQYGDAP